MGISDFPGLHGHWMVGLSHALNHCMISLSGIILTSCGYILLYQNDLLFKLSIHWSDFHFQVEKINPWFSGQKQISYLFSSYVWVLLTSVLFLLMCIDDSSGSKFALSLWKKHKNCLSCYVEWQNVAHYSEIFSTLLQRVTR